jgi:uncharacterized protein YjbI with pentapeptide repeats
MARDRFAAIVRLLATPGSRRHALGVLLGLSLLGARAPVRAKPGNRRSTRQGHRHHKDHGRHKAKDKKQQKRQRKRANRVEASATCCAAKTCTPGAGKNLSKCCYQNQQLPGASFKSSNLTDANFAGANLVGAKFQSANLTRTCFVAADISGANFTNANLSGVVFCRTSTSSGEDNSGCSRGTPCCPTCDALHRCPPEQVCCGGRCLAGNCCGTGVPSTCPAEEICCANACVPGECCTNAQCENGEVCDGGVCVPSAPLLVVTPGPTVTCFSITGAGLQPGSLVTTAFVDLCGQTFTALVSPTGSVALEVCPLPMFCPICPGGILSGVVALGVAPDGAQVTSPFLPVAPPLACPSP